MSTGGRHEEMNIQPMVVDKILRRKVVEEYVTNFDIESVGRLILGDKGRDCDPIVARMNGIEVLKDRKLQEEIDKEILEKKITPENLKVEAYKMMHQEIDGRVKVEAMKTLGKWTQLEEPATINNWNVNMSWQSVVEQAHKQQRISEHKAEEIPSADTDKL